MAFELAGDNSVDVFSSEKAKSVVYSFPKDMPIKDIIGLLGAVGFNSPPNWLRPFHVLSNGEQFRVNMARALAETEDLVVVDEFTSVVDRQVAKIACHAFQKTVRRKKIKFIAVSCHDDIVEWLQPDWIFQPGADDFQWRHLRQHPKIKVEFYPIDKAAWQHFRQHHYLSGKLAGQSKVIGGFIGDKCVAFSAYQKFPHPKTKNIMHAHRIVTLPDYQGLGIGTRMSEWLGQYLFDRGYRYRIVSAHPAIINACARSPRWQVMRHGLQNGGRATFSNKSMMKQRNLDSAKRATTTFEYRAPKKNDNH